VHGWRCRRDRRWGERKDRAHDPVEVGEKAVACISGEKAEAAGGQRQLSGDAAGALRRHRGGAEKQADRDAGHQPSDDAALHPNEVARREFANPDPRHEILENQQGHLVSEVLSDSGTHFPYPISNGMCYDRDQKKTIPCFVSFLKRLIDKATLIPK